jgi:hypothetical protein
LRYDFAVHRKTPRAAVLEAIRLTNSGLTVGQQTK